MAPTQIEEQVRALVEGIVTQAGAQLDAVTILKQNGDLVCRITVEEPLGTERLSSDALAEISRAISKAMDSADPISDAYMLEVSTPGLERELKKPEHWMRQIGGLVSVKLRNGDKVVGRVSQADEKSATVDTGAESHTIAYDEIKKARSRVDFGSWE